MKTCTHCKLEKDLSEFYLQKGRKTGQSQCKTCMNEKVRAHYNANKERYVEKSKLYRIKCQEEINKLRDVPCADCKLRFPIICMDFDHINEDKVGHVTTFAMRGNLTAALAEARKCEVVCSNCHRIRTAQRHALRREKRLNKLASSAGIEPA